MEIFVGQIAGGARWATQTCGVVPFTKVSSPWGYREARLKPARIRISLGPVSLDVEVGPLVAVALVVAVLVVVIALFLYGAEIQSAGRGFVGKIAERLPEWWMRALLAVALWAAFFGTLVFLTRESRVLLIETDMAPASTADENYRRRLAGLHDEGMALKHEGLGFTEESSDWNIRCSDWRTRVAEAIFETSPVDAAYFQKWGVDKPVTFKGVSPGHQSGLETLHERLDRFEKFMRSRRG